MPLIVDLHIHSKFSRATSADLDLENLTLWAKRKGIHVVGTGDFTHPAWFQEIQDKLRPAEEGLFRLLPDLETSVKAQLPPACQDHPVRFLLTVEVSTIYKKNGKVRKIHHVLCVPSLEAASRLRLALGRIGKLEADGRPIFGLDSRDLLEIVLESSPRSYLIPAHIWTPWFSLFGSRSGFDAIEDCFGDLTPHIFALETGLSSDPAMNWRLSALDRFAMVSHSDAHSPGKLGREANLLECELSYDGIFDAIRSRDKSRFLGTIEFYPEEGKYHFDGHRLCKIRFSPQETRQNHQICPVCKKPLTIGVLSRIEALADRPAGVAFPERPSFQNLVPLDEVIAQIYQQGPATQKVRHQYHKTLQDFGSEFSILRELPLDEIKTSSIPLFEEAIRRVRTGEISILPGYDGEYGTIQIFPPSEAPLLPGFGSTFFGGLHPPDHPRPLGNPLTRLDPSGATFPDVPDHPRPAENPLTPGRPDAAPPRKEALANDSRQEIALPPSSVPSGKRPFSIEDLNPKQLLAGLNTEQKIAVKHTGTPLLIVAGPGTGKTKTLTQRIGYLIASQTFRPEAIVALTFTNKAAREMSERLQDLLGCDHGVTICTFHRLGLQILSPEGILPRLLGDTERLAILREIDPAADASLTPRLLRDALEAISKAKQSFLSDKAEAPEISERFLPLFRGYQERLRKEGWLDIDDLLLESVRKLQNDPAFRRSLQDRFRSIHVDEYQDVNPVQVELLKALWTPDTDLCAIGDPDQAIYGFRGSDLRLFHHFTSDFSTPQRPVYRTTLWRNYRSPTTVLKAAFALISTQPDPSRMPLESLQGGNPAITALEFPNERLEAEGIVRQIELLLGGVTGHPSEIAQASRLPQESDLGFGDIAVLYRSGQQLPPLREAFDKSGIPYYIAGRSGFAERTDLHFLLAWLRFLALPHGDWLSLSSLWPHWQGIGHTAWQTLLKAKRSGLSDPLQILHERSLLSSLPKRPQQACLRLLEALREDRQKAKDLSPLGLISSVVSRFQSLATTRSFPLPEPSSLAILQDHAASSHSLPDLLTRILLQRDADPSVYPMDRVALLTIHASKGLEFPAVFVAGCEEGLLPSPLSSDPASLAEETRLLYVALTRTRRDLFLTFCRLRQTFGQTRDVQPSPLLAPLQPFLLWQKPTPSLRPRPAKATPPSPTLLQFDLFSDEGL